MVKYLDKKGETHCNIRQMRIIGFTSNHSNVGETFGLTSFSNRLELFAVNLVCQYLAVSSYLLRQLGDQ